MDDGVSKIMTWDKLCENQSKRNKYPEGLLFDIGANSGEYSSFALSCGTKNIVMVEANPRMVEFLQQKFNGVPNIVIVERAVDRVPNKIVKFYIASVHTISTLERRWIEESRFSNDFSWNNGIDVMSTSIDQLIEYYGYPSRIKIDVEGYEYNVLLGLTDRYDCEELSFEWSEELNKDLYKSIKYLDSIGFNKFGCTYGEASKINNKEHKEYDQIEYDLYPSVFKSCSEIIDDFEKILEPDRKIYWGMVFAI